MTFPDNLRKVMELLLVWAEGATESQAGWGHSLAQSESTGVWYLFHGFPFLVLAQTSLLEFTDFVPFGPLYLESPSDPLKMVGHDPLFWVLTNHFLGVRRRLQVAHFSTE